MAILWDKRQARLNAIVEADLPNDKIKGDSLFAREPLVAHWP